MQHHSSLQGKTALITGGGRGIGLAIALRFAEAGANIVVVTKENSINSANRLSSIAEQIKAVGAKTLVIDADLSDPNAIDQAVHSAISQFGSLDILVNNVSAFCFTGTLETSIEQFDRMPSIRVCHSSKIYLHPVFQVKK